MNRLDKFSGLFWLLISFIVCVESIRAHIGTFKNPGPGFLPLFAGVALCVFAIILLTSSIFRKKTEGEIISPFKGVNWGRAILFLIPLFGYTIFLSWLGYLIATFGLMLFLFIVIEKSRLWVEILFALITVLVTYMVFYRWFGIQLPRGFLGF